MKYRAIILLTLCGVIASASSALAVPVSLTWNEVGGQDNNYWSCDWHELGDGFPVEEKISSSHSETTYRPCNENPDDPMIPNIEVSITNLSGRSWEKLEYVADPETSIQNYDEWRVNCEEAFLIDNVGANTPLRSESLTANLIFEPGETWVFVIQDYVNSLGGPATPFDSYDATNNVGQVGNQSAGWTPSTGSIIACVPEPASLTLLALGGLALLRRRR